MRKTVPYALSRLPEPARLSVRKDAGWQYEEWGCAGGASGRHGYQSWRSRARYWMASTASAGTFVSRFQVRRAAECCALFNPWRQSALFRTEGSAPAGGSAEVYVDGQEKGEALITHDAYTPATLETMRYLGEGEHRVRVGFRGQGASVSTLVVRAVPEIQYATFPFTSFVQEYGTYDYAFLKRVGMLDAVNVCTARTGIVDGAVNDTTHRPVRAAGYDQLKALGKRILERRLMYNPGAKDRGLPEKNGAAGVYEYWSKSPGIGERVFDGLIIDEFSGGVAQYFPTYIEAIRRILGEDGKRLLYLYVTSGAQALVTPFSEEPRVRFVREVYMGEAATEERALRDLREGFRKSLDEYQREAPGVAGKMVFALGEFCGPPESLDRDPAVSFKVHLDTILSKINLGAAFSVDFPYSRP